MNFGLFNQSQTKVEEKVRQMFPPALADVADVQIQAGDFPQSLGSSFAEMAGIHFRASLTRFGGPCLIFNGEHDKASRREEDRFAMALSIGRVQIIAVAGHACSLDQPDLFNQTIRAFGQSIGWRMRKSINDPYPISISS